MFGFWSILQKIGPTLQFAIRPKYKQDTFVHHDLAAGCFHVALRLSIRADNTAAYIAKANVACRFSWVVWASDMHVGALVAAGILADEQ